DGFDQERHVGCDHAHDGAMGGGWSGGGQRWPEIDQHAAAAARAPELEMRQRRGRQVARPMRAQVFFGDATEEGTQEIVRESARRPRRGPRRATDYLLDQRESGSGNLAEHAVSLRKGRGISEARDYTDGRSFRVRRAELD